MRFVMAQVGLSGVFNIRRSVFGIAAPEKAGELQFPLEFYINIYIPVR